MTWAFETDPEFVPQLEWAERFVREEIEPLETLGLDFEAYRDATRPLRERVKERGLWAAFLGTELGGTEVGGRRAGVRGLWVELRHRRSPKHVPGEAPDEHESPDGGSAASSAAAAGTD